MSKLQASLYQREVKHPSLVKRVWGRFSDACQFDFETLNIIPPPGNFSYCEHHKKDV
jgi:hypothetical protein